MKRGHVTGTKRERQGASNWYKAIEAEPLKRIEAEWQAKQQGPQPLSRAPTGAFFIQEGHRVLS